MEELDVKWVHAAQVWWGWMWRTMLWVLPLSFISGIVVGIIFTVFNIDVQSNIVIPQLIGGIIGLYFSIRVMKVILTKSFNGYRIALIKVEKPEELDA